jgi:hypothetical protein
MMKADQANLSKTSVGAIKRSSPTSNSSQKKKKRRKPVSNSSSHRRRLQPRVVAVDDDGEKYWEVEYVVARRKRTGKEEYLVHWKGCPDSQNSWEPADNLCDSLIEEAQTLNLRQQEKKLGIDDDQNPRIQNEIDCAPTPQVDRGNRSPVKEYWDAESKVPQRPEAHTVDKPHISDKWEDHWDWSDEGQIHYMQVERIDVDDPTAHGRVKEARQSGKPICLVGHKGWAQFSARWLQKATTNKEINTPDEYDNSTELLDLSVPHKISVEKMEEDIGDEVVPVVRRNYNQENPIHGEISASRFLKKCWPKNEDTNTNLLKQKQSMMYMHQWQFPLSSTASLKLCGKGKNEPLPNGILGNDLLQHWLDGLGDNPFQYIFMGGTGTMSKLHRDNGGLMILIAPIVGEKEVTLVHRADGARCLYHLEATLDKIDLDRFPLMASARTWKSVIRPGEILVMPQGTYHQCRNLTPCLSYSRFYLDSINLNAFLESYLDRDSPEIDHIEVLWNACINLMEIVDKYADKVKANPQLELDGSQFPTNVASAVDALRPLRNVSREIARRLGMGEPNQQTSSEREITRSLEMAETHKQMSSKDWNAMIHDIDGTLHNFRYRLFTKQPPFRRLMEASSKVVLTSASSIRVIGDDDSRSVGELSDSEGMSTFSSALRKAPRLSPDTEGLTISDTIRLQVNDTVSINIDNRSVKGTIIRIKDRLKAAFLKFDEFPACQSEFVPLKCLRVVNADESSTEVCPRNMRIGMLVKYSDRGEEYRAEVKAWKNATFYRIALILDDGRFHFERWVTRDSIMERIGCLSNELPHGQASCRPLAGSNEPFSEAEDSVLLDKLLTDRL